MTSELIRGIAGGGDLCILTAHTGIGSPKCQWHLAEVLNDHSCEALLSILLFPDTLITRRGDTVAEASSSSHHAALFTIQKVQL